MGRGEGGDGGRGEGVSVIYLCRCSRATSVTPFFFLPLFTGGREREGSAVHGTDDLGAKLGVNHYAYLPCLSMSRTPSVLPEGQGRGDKKHISFPPLHILTEYRTRYSFVDNGHNK